MEDRFIPLLRCPVTRTPLRLQTISAKSKNFRAKNIDIVWEGLLFNDSNEWFYPVIEGVPRLLIESFLDHEDFLRHHIGDYVQRKNKLLASYRELIQHARKKNKRTKESFAFEWQHFNYEEDKTWDANSAEMMARFVRETDETFESIKGKLVFDVGCGNGLLNQLMAQASITVVAMDLSESVVRASNYNKEQNAFFIQGDLQFPPVMPQQFDIVQCSGVLIHTNNPEQSFSCVDTCVSERGKLSVWLYHPRKNLVHRLFNSMRTVTSRLPLRFQYYLYLFTLFPISYVVKKIKGNQQNAREMMIHILDWFTPQYRWEFTPEEAASWFAKRNYTDVKVTTTDLFGFNITGTKHKSKNEGSHI